MAEGHRRRYYSSKWRFNVLSILRYSRCKSFNIEGDRVEKSATSMAAYQEAITKVLEPVRAGFLSQSDEALLRIMKWLYKDESLEVGMVNSENQQAEGSTINTDLCVDSHYLNVFLRLKESKKRTSPQYSINIIEIVVIDLCRLWLQPHHARRVGTEASLYGGLSRRCFNYLSSLWDADKEITSLPSTPELTGPDLVPSPSASWSLNQQSLRTLVTLSSSSGSSLRDQIVNCCSDIFEISLLMFHRFIQFHFRHLITWRSSKLNEAPEATAMTQMARCECLEETPLSAWPVVPDICDSTILSVLDYAFHMAAGCLSSPCRLSDSDFRLIQPSSEHSRPSVASQSICPLPDLFQSCLSVLSGYKGVIVLVSGASGCGKSTLSCLLAKRLGFGTVLSTDTIRHVLRSVYSKKEYPLLHASTYEAGQLIPNDELSKNNRRDSSESAFAAPKENRLASNGHDEREAVKNIPAVPTESLAHSLLERRRCLEGYLQQSEMLYSRLEFIISLLIENGESLIVEG